jgi:predicted ATP-binding protein involved in virulence
MRINTLSLRNFCCFENRTFSLAERFNLLIGDNGSGKTSILDGLAVGLGAFFLGLPESTVARHIHRDEVRFRCFLQGDTYTREKQFPVVVECRGIINEQTGEWSRELNSLEGRTTRQNAAWIETIANNLDAQVRDGEAAILPIISYYGTGRLWLRKRQKSIDPLPPGSRFLGYLDCLDPASDEKRLLAWFKTNEIQAIQEKKPIGVLEAVRQAILTCVEHATHVWFNIAQDELLLRFADSEVPFEYLSDGYRNMLAMVADIAVRCATLNPALKDKAVRETPGIVLIDEIDLHLHPKWQRRVVSDLLAAFPKVQFVATTHSPFIIQSLVPKEGVQLLNLDNATANHFAGKSVEDISEQVQGVELPQRSQRFLDMLRAAEQYYAKLREAEKTPAGELDRLNKELENLMLPFSDDPAYQAFLRMQRVAAGIGGGNDHAAG